MTVGAMTAVDRALLLSEWAARYRTCPSCGAYQPGHGHTPNGHTADCDHDGALAERGYPDQPARDRARALLIGANAETLPPPPEKP